MKRWRRLDYAVVLDRWKTVLSEANEVQSMRDLKEELLPAMVERWCLARARRRSYRATWQCFGGWKELKGVKQLRKQFEVKLARRWRNLDIARPFCTWQRITWHNVRQQRAWQRQVRRMEINVLGAAFRKFAHTIVGKWDLETCTYCVFCPRLGLLMVCHSPALRRLGSHIRRCFGRWQKQGLSWILAHWHACAASSQRLSGMCR